MIEVRRAADLHHVEGDWFDAEWHFSFESHRDPGHDALGPLTVLNDDRLAPGAVWPLHPHKDVEGITYVVEGAFRHDDSLGNAGRGGPGLVQRMTLGSGAWHAECNDADDAPMRFIQLWLLPHTADLPPAVEQRQYTDDDLRDGLRLVLSGDPTDDAVFVHCDARVLVGKPATGVEVSHDVAAGRGAYVYVIAGAVSVAAGGAVRALTTGDALLVTDPVALALTAGADSHVLVVDVPLEAPLVGVWAAAGTNTP